MALHGEEEWLDYFDDKLSYERVKLRASVQI